MMKHDSLAERLMAVKTGKPIPPPPMLDEIKVQTSATPVIPEIPKAKPGAYKQFFISEGYKLFNVLATSVLYGFGLKALFSIDWNFIGTLGIGFLLNHFLTLTLKLLKR